MTIRSRLDKIERRRKETSSDADVFIMANDSEARRDALRRAGPDTNIYEFEFEGVNPCSK